MTDLREAGFSIADVKLSASQCDHIALSIPEVTAGRGGVRGLIDHPTVLQLLRHKDLARWVWSIVGRDLVAVKVTLFDKTTNSNWRVPWHQDRKVSVRERMVVEGYTGWSVKGGVVHVEPPTHVLEQILAVRVYIDECGPDNGPLRLMPGSHERGKVAEEEIARIVETETATEVCVERGTILAMRPLLIHSSPPARLASHRRVLHIEFGPIEAISPLQWDRAVQLTGAA